MSVWRDTLRGCRTLPHVGPHPGTWIVVCGVAAGLLFGGLGGFVFGVGLLVPMYLIGAYERARFSDRLERDKEGA